MVKKKTTILPFDFTNRNKRLHRDSSGLRFIVEKTGSGPSPTKGCRVNVLYTMRLSNGKPIDSSWKRNQPFIFKVGSGSVIKGFDLAVTYLKIGGRAHFFIPSKLAYGKKGHLPKVPKDTDLICDMKLIFFDLPIGPETIVSSNPCTAIATISKTLCCVSDNIVFFTNDFAQILKRLFTRPMKLSELSEEISKYFEFDLKQLIKFIDYAVDKGLLVIQHSL